MKRFESEMRVKAPLEKVWAFYSNPHNLPKITLPHLHLRVTQVETPLRKGSRIVFHMRRGPVPLTWESVISEFAPPRMFVDEQIHGPFEFWRHRHEFEADGEEGTRVRDTIEFDHPRGLFALAASLFLDHEIHELFRYREKAVQRLLNQKSAI